MRLIALLMAAALLFTGCTEDKPREPDPTTKPSPTATVPSMPAEAKEETVGGAAAFVKHYVEVLNYASNTGDVKELRKLSDPKCEGCNTYIDLFKRTYEAGGYYKDAEWSLSDLEATHQDSTLVVFASAHVPAGRFKTSSSATEKRGKAEDPDLAFEPSLAGGSWSLKSLSLEAGAK